MINELPSYLKQYAILLTLGGGFMIFFVRDFLMVFFVRKRGELKG